MGHLPHFMLGTSIHGHYWTCRPFLQSLVAPNLPSLSRHWRTTVVEPEFGDIELSGRFHETSGDELLIVIHGLGGSHRSSYAIDAANAAHRAGLSCLRLNLRGADRRGSDYYHAGLTIDLQATVSDSELRRFRKIYVLGYSLGGHVSLRYGTESPDKRVQSIASVCAPLDLEAGVDEIDKPKGSVYRRKVLRSLKEIYRSVARRREVPIPVNRASTISTLRQWDTNIVAPRFGFKNAREYWRSQSVAPHLNRMKKPTLIVAAQHDPMVFFHTLKPHLSRRRNIRTIVVDRGGHVGFPANLDLGLGTQGTLEDQLIEWLRNPR